MKDIVAIIAAIEFTGLDSAQQEQGMAKTRKSQMPHRIKGASFDSILERAFREFRKKGPLLPEWKQAPWRICHE
jgi:hypothetical protein